MSALCLLLLSKTVPRLSIVDWNRGGIDVRGARNRKCRNGFVDSWEGPDFQ